MLGHEGDHVGLGDRLAAFDGERDVFIGVVLEGRIYEQLARHKLDGTQHLGIADTATPELHDQLNLFLGPRHVSHPFPRWRGSIRRFSSPVAKTNCHDRPRLWRALLWSSGRYSRDRAG